MSAGHTRIIDITAGYLQIFYGLNVKLLPAKTIKRPAGNSDIRKNPITKVEQIRTGFLLDEFLPPLAPADAAVLIAFTNEDLFPDPSMSFVFGQANSEKRTAVWSLSRLDYHASPLVFLRRTIKIAVHETGHLFAIRHCTKYVCVMSGTNHLEETDSHPIDACPECTAKICWLLKVDPVERYNKLAEYCLRNGLTSESRSFLKKAQALAAAYEQK
jgi:archaemetzincin